MVMQRPALLGVALAVGALWLVACGDLFHATDWASRCDGEPSSAECAAGGDGAGASGGSSGEAGNASDGGSGNTGGSPALTHAEACQRYAAAYCPRLAECRPLLYELVGGDTQCEPRLAEGCAGSWSGAGLSMSGDDLDACVTAIGFGSSTCGGIVRISAGQVNVPACRIAGTRADGEACLDGHQCQGLGCRPTGRGYCGACFAISADGGACAADADCQPGRRCAMGACALLSDVGAPCADSAECFADLACIGGACQERSAPGVACDPMNPTCAIDSYCGAGPVCTAYLYAPLMGSCGSLPGGFTGCEYGGFCQVGMAGDSVGVCAAQGEPAEACPTAPSVFAGPCRYPSGCVDATCVVAQASTCN